MRLKLVRGAAAASACFLSFAFGIAAASAPTPIGWTALYSDSSNGAVTLANFDSGTFVPLGVAWSAYGTFGGTWAVYSRFDPNAWQNAFYYKEYGENKPEKTLFTGSWMSYFDPKTWDFAYNEYDPATSEQRHYKGNVTDETAPELILTGASVWISSWSEGMGRYVYMANDPSTGTYSSKLVDRATGRTFDLGPSSSQSGTVWTNVSYRFIGNEDRLYRYEYQYDTTDWSSRNSVSALDVSDFPNPVTVPLGFDLWSNGSILWRRGWDVFYVTYGQNWIQTYHVRKADWTVKDFAMPSWPIYDYSTGEMAGFWTYLAYSSWNPETGKNSVKYLDYETGETGEFLSGQYVQASGLNLSPAIPCEGGFLACGLPFKTYAELKAFPVKRNSNVLGFVGTAYSGTAEVSHPQSVWFAGTAYSGAAEWNSFALAWFLWSPRLGTDSREPSKFAVVGQVGDTYSAGDASRRLSDSSPIGFYGSPVKNAGLVGKYAPIGCFRDDWSGLPSDSSENPQKEIPADSDSSNLAYASPSPWETVIAKYFNQAVHATQKLVDQIDPVDLSTGEFTYDNVLMRLPGAVMPFELSVKYRSRTTYDGPMGWNWSHSYDQKLKENRDGSVTYVDGWLQNFTFKAEGGAYAYLKGLEASLSRKPEGGFVMDFLDGSQKTFDSSGMVTRIADKDGNALTLAYDSKSRLTEVRDSLNRKFDYSYGTNGRIAKVADPYWRAVEFNYFDENSSSGSLNDLESVTVDNGPIAKKTVRFTYVAGLYSSDQLHNLVTLTDSKWQEYVRNEYAFTDRVVSQKFWDGTGRFDYSMSPVREDDTAESEWSGQIVWYYVSRNFAINKRGVGTEYRFDRMGNVLERTTHDLAWTWTARTAFEYDAVWRLLKETRPSGAGTVWKYDSDGNKTEERRKEDVSLADNDFADLVTKYEYGTGSTAKLVTESVSPDGTATRYTYDGKRRLVKTETDGVILSPWTDPVTVSTEMEYDGLWRLIKTTDSAGRITEYAYSGSLLTSTHKGGVGPESVTETVEYDAFWNPVKATDGEGNVSTVAYDAFGRAVSTESAEGVKKRFSYDLNDNKLSDETEVSPGTWASTQYSYDVLDKPVSVTAALGDGRTATALSSYDGNGNVQSSTAPDGRWKGVEYDALDRPVAWKERPNSRGTLTSSWGAFDWTQGEERTVRAEYDQDGNLVKKTDANGNVWTYSYDGFGRATSTVSPEGTETRVAYDKAGNAVRSATYWSDSVAVASSSATFNALGKPLSVTAYSNGPALRGGLPPPSSDDRTTKTDYNADWSVARTYDPEGNYVTYSYDALGRLSSVRDPLGNEARTSYDRRGLAVLTQSVGNDGKTVSIRKVYDKDRRMTETRQSEGGADLVTRVTYDRLGNAVEKTDAEGRKTSYSYDWRGLPLSETDALGGTVSTTYDLAGRKTSQTDSDGRTTLYAYTPFGELSSETLPDGSAYSWTYDGNGNAVSFSDPNGNAVTTAYDEENRPVRKDVLAGSGVLGGWTLSYAYDAAGRLASATGTDGKAVAYSYDAFGGIISETSDGKTVSHSYGRRGLETGTVLPSGRALSYSYDAAGRTSAIGSAPAGGNSGNLASYSYAGNFLSSVSYGNGTSESRSYDAFGRLSALALAKPDASRIRDWNYSYDKTGNPLSDGTDSWEYDPLYRLKGVSYGLSGSGTGLPLPETFAYSANGNRTSRNFGQPDGSSSGSTSYYANQLDQYVSAEMTGTSGTGSADAYSYDLNGNLVETARYRFAYDWANRLVRVTEKARTVLAWSGSERKEIWLGSETDSGSALPPSDPSPAETPPPPADTGTSSGTETPPADSGTSSWTQVPPADNGSGSSSWTGTSDASGNGSAETSSGSTETQSGTMDPGTGSGTESWTGSETGSWTDAGTGGTSSGSVETQSWTTSSGSTDSDAAATNSGSVESGATVTEISYPERLVAEYSYDAFGRRVSKALSDRIVTYSYDAQKLVEETATDLSGLVIRTSEFAYGAGGDDDVLAEFRSEFGATAILYFAKDRLGSTVAVTDDSWNVVEEYRYSTFWSPYRKFPDGSWEALGTEIETLSGTVRPEPLTERLYTGREWDSETGLFHYRARAYSPELWRFLQRDPVGTADQMNPYAYVRNNPMAWTDPTGMVWKKLITDGLTNFVNERKRRKNAKMIIAWSYWKADLMNYGYSQHNVDWERFDKENPFARAARTRKKELMNAGVTEDRIILQRIDSEKNLRASWSEWSKYEAVSSLEVYSHGYGYPEMAWWSQGFWQKWPEKLNWTTNAHVTFHWCDTSSWAEAFSKAQSVEAEWQNSSASFSKNGLIHIPIDEKKWDDVYLENFEFFNLIDLF